MKRFLACLLIALSGAGLNTAARFYLEGQTTRGAIDAAVAVGLFIWGAAALRHREEV